MDDKEKILFIGFGSQTLAWSQNLRDSGHSISIALRPKSLSIKKSHKLRFETLILGHDNLDHFKLIALLIPDQQIIPFLKEYHSLLPSKAILLYAHGYAHLKTPLNSNYPQFNHILLAPKAIASELRFAYQKGDKLAAVYSLELIDKKNKSQQKQRILNLAESLGITAGPYPTTFKEETYADLLSEQGLLCSALPYIALANFKALRKRHINPKIAYLECWYEMKLICDTMVKMGPLKFFELISPNALIGGQKAVKLIYGEDFQAKIEELSKDIWEQKFFKEVDSTDFNSLKEEVINFWKKEELTLIHQQMAKEVF